MLSAPFHFNRLFIVHNVAIGGSGLWVAQEVISNDDLGGCLQRLYPRDFNEENAAAIAAGTVAAVVAVAE